MQIRFLKKEEIDKTKWNSCVHFANNGNVFGYIWYLNNVAKEWDGLVEGNYESVLPLIWKPKPLKTKALYQPVLLRSCGIYSVNMLSWQRVKSFLEAIPEAFHQVKIPLNSGIRIGPDSNFETNEKINFQLLLNKDYQSIALNYAEDVKDLLEKAEATPLVSVSNLKPEVIADFYKKHTTEKSLVDEKFHALQRIMYNALHRGWGFASGISDSNGDLLAVDFFIFSHGKMMSLVGAVSQKGKEQGAHLMLLDRVIQTNARRPLILDFNKNENWIKGLGGKASPYFEVIRNKGWRKFL